ncbi:MAG TPA: hypothetical protein VL092_07935 [Chitinophagaceae bacterium]|nr:hypothetical protein [Chitinophagaceae bacterium]
MKRFFYCCIITQTLCGSPLWAQQKSIQISGSMKLPDICLQVAGLNDSTQPRLYFVTDNKAAESPVAGHYRRAGHTICYTPMYPLAAGERFLVKAEGFADTLLSVLADPVVIPAIPASVADIYPLTDSIPKNILFFHVRFAQAMQESQQAWKKISILDEQGTVIPNTWRQRSFWLDSGRLLVLMIHPGRVKSGIRYIGPVFAIGKKYTLVVDSTLKDVYGRSLNTNAQRTYTVVQELSEKLKINAVSTKLRSGTKDPVSIQLNNAADHGAAIAAFSIYDASERKVDFTLVQNKTNTLLLQPLQSWEPGKYRIVRAGSFFDCAGNRFNRLFEMKGLESFRDDDKSQTIYVKAE